MADDGEAAKSHRPQEIFYRTQETSVGHRFPNPAGRATRGPKRLRLRRYGDSFGFTLRHFIVYPPDSVAESKDGRYAAVGALSAPMDTIFVKYVKDPSPAHIAGLKQGDRLVKVNDVLVTDKKYADVVQLIQNTPEWLNLLVVPKEDDILQRYFAATAYNPVSNQDASRSAAAQHIAQALQPRFQVDAVSWRSLQNPYGYDYRAPPRAQKSVDNLDLSDDLEGRRRRAQPQAPSSASRSGRRASDGCVLSDQFPLTKEKMEGVSGERAGCRLSFDSGRGGKDSTSSLGSSQADSLNSFDSSSTLTSHETNDPVSRFRKTMQQKEEFMKMPFEAAIQPKECYSRPKKLEKGMWPPCDSPKDRPTQKNFQRVKSDIDVERELLLGSVAKSPLEQGMIREAAIAPGVSDQPQTGASPTPLNGCLTPDPHRRPLIQRVQLRAKQFESGQPLPQDDPSLADRTSFFRSELARLSSKKVVPNVTERAHEFEALGEREGGGVQPRRLQRDATSISMDSNDAESDSSSNLSIGAAIANRLSGNVIISTGSKYIHCPAPSEYGQPTESLDNRSHARSNSAESWVFVDARPGTKQENRRISRQDAVIVDDSRPREPSYADPPPLIPEPVQSMSLTPSVSVTPAPPAFPRPVRPTQLDLEGPVRPARHQKAATIDQLPAGEHKPVVVKRRTKSTDFVDDERTTRRESYLRATEGGRMHIDGELSDCEASHQTHRSGSSSSSTSLDREKPISEKEKFPIVREGSLHCKVTEIDGKRSGDRSWKLVWAALKGPRLFLHKDKHHQSPMGSADAVEHYLSSGVDMRTNEVQVAEDYTKRKHVLRVSSTAPYRSEILLQAENADEFQDWFKVLQEQTHPEVPLRQQAVPQSVVASSSVLVGNSHLTPQPKGARHRSPTGQSPVSKTRKPSQGEFASPKAKTWRGRMAKQFRKMHGASSPSSPTAPEGSTFGLPLDQCLCSSNDLNVPRIVEVCTNIVDERGLQTIGIYRVPGNNASITGLKDEINKNFDDVAVDDPRWNDVHVVSSILKAYLRKIPDPLVTHALYPSFIKADKLENPEMRLKELRRLIKSLPPHNYHTLKHIILHLKRVVDNSDVNKMEAKNLAIVFGPNIVRPEDDNMESMVSNMNHQCKIVETLLTTADWFFAEESELPVPAVAAEPHDETEPISQALLLDNISKFEAFKEKEKNVLFSTLRMAAQRKVKRKNTKGPSSLNESKEDVISPTEIDLRDSSDGKSLLPTTLGDIERAKPEKVPWFNYSTDKEDFHKRIETFKQETQAMLQMRPQVEISVNNIPGRAPNLSSSVSVLNKPLERSRGSDNRRSLDNSYAKCESMMENKSKIVNFIQVRRGNSVENLNAIDANANGGLKKSRCRAQGEAGSMDSLNKVTSDEVTDLTSVITVFDEKLHENSLQNLLAGENLPYVDDSPEKPQNTTASLSDKENLPTSDLYRNPSLHKQHSKPDSKEAKHESEKDEDSTERDKPVKIKPKPSILKRSDSLNKSVKRSDSLSKTEKTENNLNKRRELSSLRRSKDTKLKRKNGMPDRSIKRRHTVGGTKDPDKVTWLDKSGEGLRTSSPDLSWAKRERLCLEINLTGNVVVALKQHLMRTRPQSFPDAIGFKVPLESHV